MPNTRRIAFVCPRFPDGKALGGAETLLRTLAERMAASGCEVSFLSTCAVNHFTWANERPPGAQTIGGLNVEFFPVDPRDEALFLRIQASISAGRTISPNEETLWRNNSVNSRALCRHIEDRHDFYDRIILGPYLFGLILAASAVAPDRSILVPCLHDEPFAYLPCVAGMFRQVRTTMFNSEPERDLAIRLFGPMPGHSAVVGMGLDSFPADPEAFSRKHNLQAPYLLYCGRREALKGTPLMLDYLDAFRARTGKDLKLVLTGSGTVEMSAGLAPHVLDVGFVSEDEKRSAMAGALAFCHPSLNESFSIVLLESWLAGSPALVRSDSKVLRFHCERSNGGLWFGNYPEFEEELLLLLGKPELRKTLGEAGRKYVQAEYAWETVEQRLRAAVEA